VLQDCMKSCFGTTIEVGLLISMSYSSKDHTNRALTSLMLPPDIWLLLIWFRVASGDGDQGLLGGMHDNYKLITSAAGLQLGHPCDMERQWYLGVNYFVITSFSGKLAICHFSQHKTIQAPQSP